MLDLLCAHEDAFWFAEPVSAAEVPDYASVISNPMDFATIRRKLRGGAYGEDLQGRGLPHARAVGGQLKQPLVRPCSPRPSAPPDVVGGTDIFCRTPVKLCLWFRV